MKDFNRDDTVAPQALTEVIKGLLGTVVFMSQTAQPSSEHSGRAPGADHEADAHERHQVSARHRWSAVVVLLFALVASLSAIALNIGTAPVDETQSELNAKANDVQDVTPAARAASAARTARVANVGRVARVAHAADAARSAVGLLGVTVAGSIMASRRYRRRAGVDDDHEDHVEPHAFVGWRVRWFDALSVKVPYRLGSYSPLLWNIAGDSNYLRAMIGPLSLALPLVGIALGVASSINVHQAFAVPSIELFVSIVILGIFDGLAGLLALVVLLLGSLLAGNFDALETPITLLVLGALWFGLSQVVRKVRTLTRPSPHGLHQWWARLGDLIIGPAIGGYLASSITEVLPVTVRSGDDVATHSLAVGLIAGACILGRYGLELIVSHFYSHDLVVVHNMEVPKQRHDFQVAAHLIETLLILLLFVVFLGPIWLAVPMLVFFALDLVVVDLFPAKRLPVWLYRLVPRNLGKILFISLTVVFIESIIAVYVESELLRIGYLLVGITAIGVVHTWLGAADGEDFPDNHLKKLGGAVLAVLTMLQLTGFLL